MAYYNDVWRIVNSSNVSVRRLHGNRTTIRDSVSFHGLPLDRQHEINDILENEQKTQMIRQVGALDSLEDVKRRSGQLIPLMLNNYKSDKPITRTLLDSISNLPTMAGVPG